MSVLLLCQSCEFNHRIFAQAERPYSYCVICGGAALSYSRMLFVQMYPVFTRFTCKIFLTDALQFMTGACATCMIDNTHVVVAAGTGAQMVSAPEMAAFAERFHFTFRAHEKGDANRSARVERPFRYVETNFLAGRTFADFADPNAQ